MKKLALIVFIIFTSSILNLAFGKQILTVHYLGDSNPITVELPMIINKGGSNTTLENSTLKFFFDKETTLGLNANFQIAVDGNTISIEGDSINRSLIEVNTKKLDEKNYEAYVKFIPSEKILAPLKNGLSVITYKNNQISFYAGNLDDEKSYQINLTVERTHFLKKDETLVNRVLTSSDLQITKIDGAKSLITIDLNKVCENRFSDINKNKITVDAKLNYDFSKIVNLKQLSNIKVMKYLEVQVRN